MKKVRTEVRTLEYSIEAFTGAFITARISA